MQAAGWVWDSSCMANRMLPISELEGVLQPPEASYSPSASPRPGIPPLLTSCRSSILMPDSRSYRPPCASATERSTWPAVRCACQKGAVPLLRPTGASVYVLCCAVRTVPPWAHQARPQLSQQQCPNRHHHQTWVIHVHCHPHSWPQFRTCAYGWVCRCHKPPSCGCA